MSSKLNIDDIEGRFNVSSFSNIILELILILRFRFSDKVLLTELSVLDICFGNFDKLFSDNYISKPNAL